jgi:hypothetical protein
MTKNTKAIEILARELYIEFGLDFYQDKRADRAAATQLWDKEHYKIEDYGGEDFDFKMNIAEKDAWRRKAKRLMEKIEW